MDSDSRTTAASSLALKTVHDRTRAVLNADLALYVRQDGDDAGDGRSETTAKATIAGALRELSRYAPGSRVTCLRVGAGTFLWPRVERPGFSLHNLHVLGAGVEHTRISGPELTPGSCSLADMSFTDTVVYVRGGDVAQWYVDQARRTVRLDNARLYVAGNLNLARTRVEVRGTPDIVLQTDHGGLIACGTETAFHCLDAPVFGAFAQAGRGGNIVFGSSTFVGEAVGKKFHVSQGGQLSRHGDNGSLDVLPGDTPGTTSPMSHLAAWGVPVAWAVVRADGALTAGERVASCTHTAQGRYDVSFLPSLGSYAYFGLGTATDTAKDVSLTVGPGRTGTTCTVFCKRNGTLAVSGFAMAFFITN